VLEQKLPCRSCVRATLLSLFEGKAIDFLVLRDNKQELVSGRIIRSGYVPHSLMAMRQYGSQYYQAQMAYAQGGSEQPIVRLKGNFASVYRERHYSPPSATTLSSSRRCNGCSQRQTPDPCGLSFHM